MMKLILATTLFVSFLGVGNQAIKQSNNSSDKLSIRDLNHEKLNRTVFRLINEKRNKKGLDTLSYNEALNKVATKYQDEFEFRRFKNTPSIERKINKDLFKRTKKAGFDGGLVLPVVGEFEALDYDEKQEFFLNKEDKDSEFKLYYGKRPRKSEKNPMRNPIEPMSYEGFAKLVLKNLESDNKKALYSKAYKWGGVHLQWYYKSLNKRKIPQIKMVFLLGGYATVGMRID